MSNQVVAKVILLSTIFLWTVQPAILGPSAALEAFDICSVEVDTDVELDQFDMMGLPVWTANITANSFLAALPARLAPEAYISSHQHLRGPPMVSFS